MLHTNTSTLQDPKDMLEEERRFYKDLYTEPTHRQEYNEDEIAHDFLSNLPQLDEEQKTATDIPITMKECTQALRALSQ